MTTLTLLLCLTGDPVVCREIETPFDGPLLGCAVAGQFQAATWVAEHPRWQLKRWWCGPARGRA